MHIDTDKGLLKNEFRMLLVLAAVQFTNIMDFMIIMPLGPQFLRLFDITPKQFGLLVSAYTFSASLFGFIAVSFVDKYDRKKVLLTLYAGFIVGNILCAISPSYILLLIARTVTGAFGGILGGSIFTIIGDVIPDVRRGRATGIVMSSFSASSIFGVPVGLALASYWDWHAPFIFLIFVSSFMFILAFKILKPMKKHLEFKRDTDWLRSMTEVFFHPTHLNAFLLITMMMFASFSVIPYMSAYMVSNAGMKEVQLPYMYFAGGASTLFTAPLVGKLSDRFGKLRMFIILAALSIIPITLVTNLPAVPLALSLIVTTLYMVLVSGRFIPAMALITNSIAPKYRGRFMSMNSSVNHLASGLAAFTAAQIIVKNSDGRLEHYNVIGYLAVASTFACFYLAIKLSRRKPITGQSSTAAHEHTVEPVM